MKRVRLLKDCYQRYDDYDQYLKNTSYCYFCYKQTESFSDKFSDTVWYNGKYFDAHVIFCVECGEVKHDESWFE